MIHYCTLFIENKIPHSNNMTDFIIMKKCISLIMFAMLTYYINDYATIDSLLVCSLTIDIDILTKAYQIYARTKLEFISSV